MSNRQSFGAHRVLGITAVLCTAFTAQVAWSSEGCEYKAVMTDAEIEACKHPPAPPKKLPTSSGQIHQTGGNSHIETDEEVRRRASGYKPADPNEIKRPEIGMRADEIKDHLQIFWKPTHINRTITKAGVSEQWVTSRGYIYVTNGVVTSIQEQN